MIEWKRVYFCYPVSDMSYYNFIYALVTVNGSHKLPPRIPHGFEGPVNPHIAEPFRKCT